jgi:Hypoxia induced protein conserved region
MPCDKGAILKTRDTTGVLNSSKVSAMTYPLVLLIGGFAIAAATALVRGLLAFFRDGEHLRQPGKTEGEAFGVQQNRMMTQRVMFQGIAVVLIMLVGALAGAR